MRAARIAHVDWSLHEVQLRDLWAQGKSCSTIAAVLGHGITRNAVIGKIHRLKIEGRHRDAKRSAARVAGRMAPGLAALPKPKAPLLSKTQKQLALKMLDDGDFSPREIAEKLRAMPLAIQALVQGKRAKSRPRDDGLRLRRQAGRAEYAAPALPLHNVLLAFADGYNGQRGRVALVDLEAQHCRFPVDMPDGAVKYCGLGKEESGSYCPAHALRCVAS